MALIDRFAPPIIRSTLIGIFAGPLLTMAVLGMEGLPLDMGTNDDELDEMALTTRITVATMFTGLLCGIAEGIFSKKTK